MPSSDQSFLDSLDLQHTALEPFIPFILEDLWELGSIPEYIIQLARKHINPQKLNRVVDFGCGKGAVLIKLWQEMPFQGVGIDLVPEFVTSAQKYAEEWNCADSLTFEAADIRKRVTDFEELDLAIFGQDSEVLGNVTQALKQLKECVANDGWMIVELACWKKPKAGNEDLPSEEELFSQIEASGLKLVDKIVWDVAKLIEINRQNMCLIQYRLDQLTRKYPDQRELFNDYLKDQKEECRELEEEILCMSLILQK